MFLVAVPFAYVSSTAVILVWWVSPFVVMLATPRLWGKTTRRLAAMRGPEDYAVANGGHPARLSAMATSVNEYADLRTVPPACHKEFDMETNKVGEELIKEGSPKVTEKDIVKVVDKSQEIQKKFSSAALCSVSSRTRACSSPS